MALATWWQGDPLPYLPKHSNIEAHIADDDTGLAALNRISIREVRRRRAAGHKPYIAEMCGIPAAYGWVATHTADIGELGLQFGIPSSDRYLWDFATLPEWQGQGLYPRLLQAIIRAEAAERFWIIYAPENLPSGKGIEAAGFTCVGQVSYQRDGVVGLVPLAMPERAGSGAVMLNVPLLDEELSPCWRCMRKAVCTCQRNPESCICAIPVRESQLSPSVLQVN